MNKKIELLAPAGNYESFIAAIENGADAVYMGGKLFNARANANNFNIEELEELIKYAHLRDSKVYITMNTLLNDNELIEALDFAYDLYRIGVDAIIVQDLGLAKVLHDYIPDMPLHASTQMTIYNLAGVKELESLGFTRVVLARELSIKEIEYICDNTNIEIEVFIHGALCISYSGQCLMSSMIGDRSGNRGKCAQPCRLPYKLLEDDKICKSGYLLSPKDLSVIEILDKFSNVHSLKIEGRMKSPEYVAIVVKTYRKYLDNILNNFNLEISKEDKDNLLQIFNRGGFTDAYLNSKNGKDMMCYEKPKNWGTYIGKVTNYDGKKYITLDNASNLNIGDGIEIWSNQNESPSTIISEIINNKIGRIHGNINIGDKVYKTSSKLLLQTAKETYSRGYIKKASINISIFIIKDTPISIKINNYIYTSNIIPEIANKAPITKENIISQFKRTGDTPFSISNINITLNDNLFVPVSVLNKLRRDSIKQYTDILANKTKREIEKIPLKKPHILSTNSISKKVSVYIHFLKERHIEIKNVNNFYFTFKDALLKQELIQKFNGRKYILLPTITKSNYHKLIEKNIVQLSNIVDGFVISNIGQLEYVKNLDKDIIANYTFNIFNSYSANYLHSLGINKIILSPELTQKQINSISISNCSKELMVYGRQCVMTSEYCPIGSIVGDLSKDTKCNKPCIKDTKYYLKDRIGMKFLILSDNIDCQSSIYNCKITSISSKNLNIDSIKIDIFDETIEEIQNIINVYKSGNKLSGENYTNGHMQRPV